MAEHEACLLHESWLGHVTKTAKGSLEIPEQGWLKAFRLGAWHDPHVEGEEPKVGFGSRTMPVPGLDSVIQMAAEGNGFGVDRRQPLPDL